MSDILKIDVRGADELAAFFKTIPDWAKPIVLKEFAKYVIGNDSRGLRHYPNYQSPTYRRTYKLKNSWKATEPEGSQISVATPIPYGIYPMGNPPTRVMQRIGWKSALDRVFSNMAGGIRSAQLAVIRAIKAGMG